jgi:hypothetical protein
MRHAGRVVHLGDLLRYADPTWLATVERGLNFVVWGVLAWLGFLVVGVFFLRQGHVMVPAWLDFVAAMLCVYGAWLTTEPDPSELGGQRRTLARRVVRVALVAAAAGVSRPPCACR